MNRSSPLKVTPTSSCEPPAFTASAARYSPTGQPSVRRTSSCTSASAISTSGRPHAGRRPRRRPSPDRRRRSRRMPPWARRRAAGSGNAFREPIASCDPAGRPKGDGGERVEALPVGHRLEVVDDEGNGSPHGVHRGDQTPGDVDTHGRGRDGAEHGRVDRLDAVQRHRDGGRQDGGVVVAVVDRDPSHPWPLALGPLCEQGRLAVAGRGDHGDDRRAWARGSAGRAGLVRVTIPGRAAGARSFELRDIERGLGEAARGHRSTRPHVARDWCRHVMKVSPVGTPARNVPREALTRRSRRADRRSRRRSVGR